MGDYNYYSPWGSDPLSGIQNTLSSLMMFKKQQDEQEKARAQQTKDELNRLKMQHDLQKNLIVFQNEQERQARNQQATDNLKRIWEQSQQAEPSLRNMVTDRTSVGPEPNGQYKLIPGGQEVLGAAEYGARMGEPIPGQQILNYLKGVQGYQVNADDLLRYQQALEAAQIRANAATQNAQTGATSRVESARIGAGARTSAANIGAGARVEAAKLGAGSRQYTTDQNNQTRMTIAQMNHADRLARLSQTAEFSQKRLDLARDLGNLKNSRGNSAIQARVRLGFNYLIEKTAKDTTGKEVVNSDDRAQAIKDLATIDPELFGEYMSAVQESPGLLSTVTGGRVGGTVPKLKPSANTNKTSPNNIKSKEEEITGRFNF